MFFDKTEKLILSVEGMHCNHCKARVENALTAIKGVKKAEADLATGDVTVTFVPSKTDANALCDAVNALGFSAKLK
jgi:copper chaperone